MQIQVLYFAVFRERLGADGETLELPEGAHVGAAIEALGGKHDVIGRLVGKFQVAVNQEMVSFDHELADGDELALIPPVAGGTSGGPDTPARHARIVERPPSIDECVAAVSSPDMGGLVTFTGVVRRRSQGRNVERLEYEAYAEMAEKVFNELADAIEAEIPGCRLAIQHRVGKLVVGDIAVVIAAAAPHRAEAFQACRAMIDRLKDHAPIWKKEIGPDGEEWVGLGP